MPYTPRKYDREQRRRIKLAEAMNGARVYTQGKGVFRYQMYRHPVTGIHTRSNKFDPFTDANDDYAVLEWMRSDSNAWEYQYEKELMLTNFQCGDYQIGDYARAALKVLT